VYPLDTSSGRGGNIVKVTFVGPRFHNCAQVNGGVRYQDVCMQKVLCRSLCVYCSV
jgi:hypothetical protein